MRSRILCLSACPGLLFVFLAISGASAGELTVPDDPDCGTIQDCIDAAADHDTITVHPGVYRENVDFKGKAVTLRSLEGPEATTIEGNRADAAVVTFVTEEGSASVLDGFTIRHGGSSHGPGLAEGIFCRNASPVIQNNRITETLAPDSGNGLCCGIRIEGGAPVIRDNRIEGNGLAEASAPGWLSAYTYAILFEDAAPRIEGNRIASNVCGGAELLSSSYGIYGRVGGDGSVPVVVSRNTIVNNTAQANGLAAVSITVGVFLTAGGPGQEMQIQNNVVAGNVALPGMDVYAYGILIETCLCGHVLLSHNTVAGNAGHASGGAAEGVGLYAAVGGVLTAVNNIVSGNHQGICFSDEHGSVLAGGNNVWNNRPGGDYCDGMSAGESDLSQPPLFVDPLAGNYHLTAGSPCIDRGTALGGTDEDMDAEHRPEGDGFDIGADEWVATPAWTASTAGAASPCGPGPANLSRAVSFLLMLILPVGLLRALASRRR